MSILMQMAQVAAWIPGARLIGPADLGVLRLHTDSRSLEPGDLFVALKGEHFDANDLLAEAYQRGAIAAICHPGAGADVHGLSRIEVPDTKQALGDLAAAWRRQFSIPLIAVTGSNGKTTVTQMLASVLDAFAPDGASLATRGNLNNDIGVPLTLLRLRATHTIAVVELGMNHPGEIAALANMAQPTVALINNAQREHLEFMQTVQAVAEENGAAIAALPTTGTAVFPADDDFTTVWRRIAAERGVVDFALEGPNASVACLEAHWNAGAWQVRARTALGELQYNLAIAGRHNVKNSLAAVACAVAAGVPLTHIAQGLAAFLPVKGRSRAQMVHAGAHSYTLVDDTYNANPDSVRAAIDVLAELPGPRLLVLGDMGEVGMQGPQFHAEAGRYAKAKGIEQLLTLGSLATCAVAVFEGARHFDTMTDLVESVQAQIPHVSSVLVKGSRFMRMERVVEALHAH